MSKKIVGLTLNFPGPLALHRLSELGHSVTKIEGPQGDPLAQHFPDLYQRLHKNILVQTLDLKLASEQEKLLRELANADLFLTTMRSQSLRLFGLDRESLTEKFSQLRIVQLIGTEADENFPSHDLNVMFEQGLISADHLPRGLYADTLAAERLVSASLQMLLSPGGGWSRVSLEQCANLLAWPRDFGLTSRQGLLDGTHACYTILRGQDCEVAIACVEPKFWRAFCVALKVSESISVPELEKILSQRTGQEIRQLFVGLPVSVHARTDRGD